MSTKEEIIKNLERCPSFNRCSQNLCPLDLELHLRSGREQDKCRWMREPKKKKIGRREICVWGQGYAEWYLEFRA